MSRPETLAPLPVTETLPIAAAKLLLTDEERAILLGCMSRKELIVLRSRQAMADLIEEEGRHIARIAERLGLTTEQLTCEYTIDLDTRNVTPKPAS